MDDTELDLGASYAIRYVEVVVLKREYKDPPDNGPAWVEVEVTQGDAQFTKRYLKVQFLEMIISRSSAGTYADRS